MDIKNELNALIIQKKENISSKEETEKMKVILELIKDKDCFFKMPVSTSIGILEFLDVPEDKILPFYKELVSYQSYCENVPQERVSIIK